MFGGSEYKSYITLCSELRLERDFVEGDYAAWAGSLDGPWEVLLIDAIRGHVGHRALFGYGPANQAWSVWLPRLDQWLDLLEAAARTYYYRFWRVTGGYRMKLIENRRDGTTKEYRADAPSREEAAARLWMAVTGQ